MEFDALFESVNSDKNKELKCICTNKRSYSWNTSDKTTLQMRRRLVTVYKILVPRVKIIWIRYKKQSRQSDDRWDRVRDYTGLIQVEWVGGHWHIKQALLSM